MRGGIRYVMILLALVAAWGAGPRAGSSADDSDYAVQREHMVRTQIEGRGIRDPRLLETLRRIPRHEFMPEAVRKSAYGDHPAPIGYGQTISQPYIVAFMTDALKLTGREKVLEIGTGSGYQAAVLAELCEEVYTIEIVAELADRARKTLERLGYAQVHVRRGDGYLGWPEHAPYDRIIVTAAPPEIPRKLVEQLKIGGRMVAPVGKAWQELVLIEKSEQGLQTKKLLPVRFVPMVPERRP